jgi:hypothetical protein
MNSLQSPVTFLGPELYVLAFQSIVFRGEARYIHGREKNRTATHQW